jgi:hypothetical protein
MANSLNDSLSKQNIFFSPKGISTLEAFSISIRYSFKAANVSPGRYWVPIIG